MQLFTPPPTYTRACVHANAQKESYSKLLNWPCIQIGIHTVDIQSANVNLTRIVATYTAYSLCVTNTNFNKIG